LVLVVALEEVGVLAGLAHGFLESQALLVLEGIRVVSLLAVQVREVFGVFVRTQRVCIHLLRGVAVEQVVRLCVGRVHVIHCVHCVHCVVVHGVTRISELVVTLHILRLDVDVLTLRLILHLLLLVLLATVGLEFVRQGRPLVEVEFEFVENLIVIDLTMGLVLICIGLILASTRVQVCIHLVRSRFLVERVEIVLIQMVGLSFFRFPVDLFEALGLVLAILFGLFKVFRSSWFGCHYFVEFV